MILLAGDIGGTKTALGLFELERVDPARAAPAPIVERTYASADFPGLLPIVQAFLAEVRPEAPVATACFGVAGPVIDNRCETSNLPWVIDGAELGRALDIHYVELINDLVALAEGVPALREDELRVMNPGRSHAGPRRPRALIAAGTGLGVALLMPSGDGWTVCPSEGGHASYAPHDPEEVALLGFLQVRLDGHVSRERVASGSAIPSLYEFACAQHPDWPELDDVRTAFDSDPVSATPLISQHGQDGECRLCALTMRLFLRAYGAAAGDLALTGFATGGVFVGGGIAKKILPLLLGGTFMEAFVAKGRFEDFLRDIPVRIILNDHTGLLGAARRAATGRTY